MASSPFVNVDVPDLDLATAFYLAAFGLRVGRRFGQDGVELLGAATPIYLLVNAPGSSWSPGARGVRDYVRHWTPVHLDFEVTDVDAAVQRAVSAGATLESPPQDRPWGRIAVLSDPFGHGFCFLTFNAKGYDAIAT